MTGTSSGTGVIPPGFDVPDDEFETGEQQHIRAAEQTIADLARQLAEARETIGVLERVAEAVLEAYDLEPGSREPLIPAAMEALRAAVERRALDTGGGS